MKKTAYIVYGINTSGLKEILGIWFGEALRMRLFKLLYLVSQNISEKWTMPLHNWSLIFQQLSVHFEGRLEARQ